MGILHSLWKAHFKTTIALCVCLWDWYKSLSSKWKPKIYQLKYTSKSFTALWNFITVWRGHRQSHEKLVPLGQLKMWISITFVGIRKSNTTYRHRQCHQNSQMHIWHLLIQRICNSLIHGSTEMLQVNCWLKESLISPSDNNLLKNSWTSGYDHT